MWFSELTGFPEESPQQVRDNLILDGPRLISKANDRVLHWGQLEVASLGELRESLADLNVPAGKLRLSEVVGDVQKLHCAPENHGALFQVASQFNLLEMTSPHVTPEQGIDCYEYDLTQGPACAIACGAGTLYRNYFVPLSGGLGQTTNRQIDCLAQMGDALGNQAGALWQMHNGYALASEAGLRSIAKQLRSLDEPGRDKLRAQLRIGLQWDTEVTLSGTTNRVTQAYCSALPVTYSRHASTLWEPFAELVLEAAYEATFAAAVLNRAQHGSSKLYLTLLGGGAFGNRESWILAAIRRAAKLFQGYDLDVGIVSYRSSQPGVYRLVQEFV